MLTKSYLPIINQKRMKTSNIKAKSLFVNAVLVLVLFFLFPRLVFASEITKKDWGQYYFTGKVDVEKYPHYKSCGYGQVIRFNIYDNKFFIECQDEEGMVISKAIDGYYELTSEAGVVLKFYSTKGKIKDLNISFPKNFNQKNIINLENNSCELAEFMFKFYNSYNLDDIMELKMDYTSYHVGEIKQSPYPNTKPRKIPYNLYRLGSYDLKQERYFFDWFVDVFEYKGKILSVYSYGRDRKMEKFMGLFCLKILNKKGSDKNLIIEKSCALKEEEIYLKVRNCVVYKYQGQLTIKE